MQTWQVRGSRGNDACAVILARLMMPCVTDAGCRDSGGTASQPLTDVLGCQDASD